MIDPPPVRKCWFCHAAIHECMGFTLGRDIVAVFQGIFREGGTRELCQFCADKLSEFMGPLCDETRRLKIDIQQYQESRDLFARQNMVLNDNNNKLIQENTILRGLVQHNPEWKCPYGHKIETMALCPSGFPGCACADDLMLGESEAYRSFAARVNK